MVSLSCERVTSIVRSVSWRGLFACALFTGLRKGELYELHKADVDFSGAAIALALALYGTCGKSARAVRVPVNDWKRVGASARGWRSLRRWAGAVAAGTLFAGLGLGVLAGSPREVARRAAQALCGHAPIGSRSAPVEHQAQIGQGHVS